MRKDSWRVCFSLADPGGGLNLLAPKRISPLLDQADGAWNFGEAALGSAVDSGACFGPLSKSQIETGLTSANILTLDDWKPAPDEILFAPCYNAMDHAGTPLRTRLYVLRHNPATNKLDVVAAAVLGVANSDLVGYGASALRVANLNGDATRHVIVATLNGELTVFEWDASGQTLGSRVFSLVTEGSLGGYGAMLVQDLDPANGLRPEIYLATSSGIRKWRIP